MKPKWKADEKRMLVFTGAICLSLFGAGALYEWNNRVPDLKIPQAEMPQPNAYDFYAQAAELFKVTYNSVAPVDAPFDSYSNRAPALYSKAYFQYYPLARKQNYLAANGKVLQLMQQGADYSYLQPPERDGKDVMPSEALARLLTVQAHARAQVGNWDKAADSILNVLHFSYQMQRGTSLRGALRGNATRAMGEKDLKILLPHLSAKKAKLVAKQIEVWETSRVLPSQILEEEKRAMQAVILQLIRKRDFRPLYVSYGCIGDCNIPPEQYEEDLNRLNPFLKLRLAWMNKPHLLAEYSRCMNWHIAQSELPFAQRSKTSPFPDSDDAIESMIHPQYQELHDNLARQEINTALTLTMVALHAYKLDHKKYPQQLSALVPEYLKRVPLDPCSDGKKLRYRLKPMKYIILLKPQQQKSSSSIPSPIPAPMPAPSTPSSALTPSSLPIRDIYGTVPFKLYSIGFNARDDGGIPYEDKTTNDDKRYQVNFRLPENAKVDIVAGIN